jgi:ElaB/YqjD/DUF883 family membrane-anchored ribosome-binding protein
MINMNDQILDKKVRQDAARVKKDIDTLVGDSSVRLSKLGDNVSQAAGKVREDINSRVDEGVSQLNERIDKITGDALETISNTADSVKTNVDYGLNQYNAKVQEYADKVPGGISQKAVRYPWVTITLALAVGFLLGNLFKPRRQTYW